MHQVEDKIDLRWLDSAEGLFPCVGLQVLLECGHQLGSIPRLNRAVHVLIGDAELNSIASAPSRDESRKQDPLNIDKASLGQGQKLPSKKTVVRYNCLPGCWECWAWLPCGCSDAHRTGRPGGPSNRAGSLGCPSCQTRTPRCVRARWSSLCRVSWSTKTRSAVRRVSPLPGPGQ